MNIDLVKQFISMRKELYKNGVFGVSMYENEVQIVLDELVKLPNLFLEKIINNAEYPYKVCSVIDGIRFFNVISYSELDEFPEIKELAKQFEAGTKEEEPLPFADEEYLIDDIMLEDMHSEEYVSSFDLRRGEAL